MIQKSPLANADQVILESPQQADGRKSRFTPSYTLHRPERTVYRSD